MHTNGSGAAPGVAPTWRAEDFAALEAYNGEVTIDLFAGARPPIVVDARRYDQLAYLGVIGNPLAQAAVEAFYAASAAAQTIQAAGHDPRDFGEQFAAAQALQDRILAAVCVRPPYCPRDRLGPDGRPPPGHFWYGSLTDEQRRLIADFFYNGADALRPFRARADADEPAGGDGERLEPAPERDPDPAGASLPALVAGRGGPDLAERPPPGGGADAARAGAADHGAYP